MMIEETISWDASVYQLVSLRAPSNSPYESEPHRSSWVAAMSLAYGLRPYRWGTAAGTTPQAAIDAAIRTIDTASQGVYTKDAPPPSIDIGSLLDDL